MYPENSKFSSEMTSMWVRTSTTRYDDQIKNFQTQTDEFSHLPKYLANTTTHKFVHSTPDLCIIAILICCSVLSPSDLLSSNLYFADVRKISETAMKCK